MSSVFPLAVLFACLVLASPTRAAAQTRAEAVSLPRVAIEDVLSRGSAALRLSPVPIPVAVRLVSGVDDRALDARIAAYSSQKIPVWLALEPPSGLERVESWRLALQSVLARHRDAIAIVEIGTGADPRLGAFVTRLAATEVRSARESILVALGGAGVSRSDRLVELYTPALAPYVDILVIPASADEPAASAFLMKVDPETRVALLAGDAGEDPEEASRRILEHQLETLGTNVVMVAWRTAGDVQSALKRLAPLASLLSGDVTELEASAAGLSLVVDGRDVTADTRHRLLFDNKTFATFLVYWADQSSSLMDISLTLPVEGEPAVFRLTDGAKLGASDYTRNPETSRVRARVPRPGGPMLVDFNAGAAALFVERSDVSAERQLSVQEIIARHQQQQRAQDALVRNYTASARSEQHFRPSMTDPGYDVVTENRYFVAADGVEWEERSFSVNGSKWGADRPPFPLLQPEKVLSLPLQLRFDNDYTYRLDGTDRVGDYECYVVRFEPLRTAQSLYRGTVWIDRKTFARVRVSAVQLGLSAPVVSNEEIQTYAPVTSIGNRPVFLFSGLTARQIVLIAGRNILVEKMVAFDDFRINDPAFDEARTAARRSDRVMYRETDKGLRYCLKEGEARVVSERATRSARALAMGVTLDPSYAFPLPIFGINYLNFQFRGREDTQLAILFAGVLAAGNIQRPKLGGSPLDASVDFFAIAVPSSDRLYEASGEREAERLLTWPLTTGLNLGWQYTPFQKVSAQYQFRFDGYVRDTTTADTFVVPSSTVTNGIGGAWEYRRGGYSAVGNGAWFRRAGWRDWGFAPDPESGPTYVKYSASLSRDFYFNVFHKIHLNAAWFGGRDLDRFAKYQFGMFDDTRIHGVPASGARFEELGMTRGSYSFNIFDQYRLDLFLEQAWGRDRALDDAWQPITGIGAAVNLRAPWGTILRVDAGKSFLPDRYRGIGFRNLADHAAETASLTPMRTLRADLHVHSWQSRQAGNMRFLKSRDCYSDPENVYRVAKARGMDLVTITDHDSIDGCLEFLDRHPDADDFFVSEEVSCRLPDGDVEVHLGVYGMTERLHRELQPLRGNVFDVATRLREAGVFFVLNHLLHFYRRQLPLARYLCLLDAVPALEVRNGTMLPAHNALTEQIAMRWGSGGPFGLIGGSDAHTLRRIGRTWTEAPGETVADFLASLANRQSRAGGDHGCVSDVTRDAYEVIGRYVGSLVGRGPCDLHPIRRAACLAFSVISLPAQFLPLAIVASGKRREAREVHRVEEELSASLDRPPFVTSPAAAAPEFESQA